MEKANVGGFAQCHSKNGRGRGGLKGKTPELADRPRGRGRRRPRSGSVEQIEGDDEDEEDWGMTLNRDETLG